MNEVQLLRAQLSAEREHWREVVSLCASRRAENYISQDFIISYTNYILFCMSKEHARSTTLLERSSPGDSGAIDDLRRALFPVTAALGELRRPARTTAHRAVADGRQRLEALHRCVVLVDRLIESRRALEALTEHLFTVDDWRRLAHVDANSILEERKLRAEVLRHGAGV